MGVTYRYRLTRTLPMGRGRVCWVMLNPSTADATTDDPTIRRVLGFSGDHGFAAVEVVNLFAARATTPRRLGELAGGVDVAGPGNGRAIGAAVRAADAVVVAWGAAVPPVLRAAATQRIDAIVRRCRVLERPTWCLATTRDGHPRHPLYVPATTPLHPWAPPSPPAAVPLVNRHAGRDGAPSEASSSGAERDGGVEAGGADGR